MIGYIKKLFNRTITTNVTVNINEMFLDVKILVNPYSPATLYQPEEGGIREHEILSIHDVGGNDVTEYIINIIDNDLLREKIIDEFEKKY